VSYPATQLPVGEQVDALYLYAHEQQPADDSLPPLEWPPEDWRAAADHDAPAAGTDCWGGAEPAAAAGAPPVTAAPAAGTDCWGGAEPAAAAGAPLEEPSVQQEASGARRRRPETRSRERVRQSRYPERRSVPKDRRRGKLPPAPEPQPSGLAAIAIHHNLVITQERSTAWYVLPLRAWSFLTEPERLAILAAQCASLQDLAGRTCQLRVTSRPFRSWEWAEAADASFRNDACQPLAGPCPTHSLESHPACPTCVQGHGWFDWLADEQARVDSWATNDRMVYLGVDILARSGLARMLSTRWSAAARAEYASFQARVDRVTASLAAPGMRATPATPEDIQWLFTRSCGLLLPAPLPPEVDAQPVPYALPGGMPADLAAEDLGVFTTGVDMTADPYDKTVTITRADGLTEQVAILSIGPFASHDVVSPSPWIQRTDLLTFPTEWSVTFQIRDRARTLREMGRKIGRIRSEDAQFYEFGMEPPVELERQLVAAKEIEDAVEHGHAPETTRIAGWFRLAVGGATTDEALARARAVTELFRPEITIVHEADQYRLAREFIPGEALANTAHMRRMDLQVLTSGMPAASAMVGDQHGFALGTTTSLAIRPVFFHPWAGPEDPDNPSSGLCTLTGGLGSGKSTLAGLIVYAAVRAGVPTVVLDPSGMLDRLCAVPEIRRVSQAVNLLESPPGTLCPYRMIADPPGAGDMSAQQRDDAERTAEAQRRALVIDILKMLLPARVLDKDTEFALREAARVAPALASSSPVGVIEALRHLERESLKDHGARLAGTLEDISREPLARLFFPPPGTPLPALRQGKVLTVMTLRGLVIPGDDRPAEERTHEEQLSVAVLHLAAQLVRRLLLDYPRHARKLMVLDESHQVLRDPVGRQMAIDVTRDSRKNNLCALYISQLASDLIDSGLGSLVGTVFAFRTTSDKEASATVELLHLPHGQGHEADIAELSGHAVDGYGTTGECLMRDRFGRVERVQIDLSVVSALQAALNSTPGGVAAPQEGSP
jgi:AAA-like domain